MAVKKEIVRTGWQEAAGILLLALCVLSILSLFSYDPGDISALHALPNQPPENFIGPVGAWFGFLTLMALGVCGYLVPAAFAYIGLLCLFKREGRIWPKVVWSTVLVLVLASLAELDPEPWAVMREKLNVGSTGGLLGDLVATRFVVQLLGTIGTGILMVALALVSIVMIVEVRPGTVLRHAWDYLMAVAARIEALRKARMDRLRQLEEEQRELQKRRRRLEEAMKSTEPAAPVVKVRSRTPPPVEEPAEPPEPPARIRKVQTEPAPTAASAEGAPAPEPAEDVQEDKPLLGIFGRKGREPKPEPATAPQPKREKAVEAESLAVLPSAGANWTLPTNDMLDPIPEHREVAGDFQAGGQVLKETLAEFGVEVDVTNVERGPVVTRYELLPAPGVRVERIAALSNNIALAMKAETVRVQAPIPGKGVVGIEVPNPKTTTVYLREIMDSEEWKSGKAALPLALGQDVGGRVQIADLADMPHLLVAGATGSGKTVCMNSVLAGLLMSRTPEQMRLMLIDPKIVEFSAYNQLPHLVVPVITDAKKVSLGLRWAINEMEKRYKLFAKVGVRNIKAFNSRPIAKQEELFGDQVPPVDEPSAAERVPDRVPYIVIVVDELADLMLVAQADIENQIARLAQLSRAVGIHMILATQRPSVNVITGTIKANFPARISFQVAQKVDSRTILDAAGADKLLGKGDMLFLPPGSPKLIRAQGTLTTDAEIGRVIAHWKQQGQPQYETSIKDKIEGKQVDLPDMEEDDEMLQQALEIIRQTRRASTSSLQRRLRIGYTRAARIMDLLEQRGVVGPAQGADPREILIDLDGEVPQNEMKEAE